MKSENLNFLEPSGPLQACNGTAYCIAYLSAFIASGFWPHNLRCSAGDKIVDVLDNFFFVFVAIKLSFVAIFSDLFSHVYSVRLSHRWRMNVQCSLYSCTKWSNIALFIPSTTDAFQFYA
jgi:hypothetical protein